MHRAVLALAVMLALAGCGGNTRVQVPAQATAGRAPFAYDRTKPLGLRDLGRANDASYPIAIRRVSYLSGGRRIQGYLLVPPHARNVPAVVYLHGAGGSRSEFVLPA